jgi:hypothetical protein
MAADPHAPDLPAGSGGPRWRLWGRRLFVVACALAVLAGALAFRLVHAETDRALVGGGALVSALVAAVVVRFWNEEVDLARWLEAVTPLELRVPSWSLAGAWAVYQAALLWAARGAAGGLQNAGNHREPPARRGAGALDWRLAEAHFGARPALRPPRSLDIEKVARGPGDLDRFQLLRAETPQRAQSRRRAAREIAVEHDQATRRRRYSIRGIRRGAPDRVASAPSSVLGAADPANR